jgi:hypothetical protein
MAEILNFAMDNKFSQTFYLIFAVAYFYEEGGPRKRKRREDFKEMQRNLRCDD